MLNFQEQQQTEILNLNEKVETLSEQLHELNAQRAETHIEAKQNGNKQLPTGNAVFPVDNNASNHINDYDTSGRKIRRTEKKPVDIESFTAYRGTINKAPV